MNEATKLAKREPDPQELESRGEPGSYRAPVYGYGLDPAGEGEVHLLDYWRAVRKRLWLVFGIAALITALATIYVARKPDIYEASARVQVDTRKQSNVRRQDHAFHLQSGKRSRVLQHAASDSHQSRAAAPRRRRRSTSNTTRLSCNRKPRSLIRPGRRSPGCWGSAEGNRKLLPIRLSSYL